MASKSRRRRKQGLPITAAALLREGDRQGQRSTLPPSDWRAEQIPLLMKEHGAFGCLFGMKHRAGRFTREPALVILTSNKHDPRPRSGGVRKVPKRMSWKDGARRHALTTDVLEVQPTFELLSGAVFGPGDGAFAGGEFASIGAAVDSPRHGRCVTTAGHLFRSGAGAGTPVRVQSDEDAVTCTAAEIKLVTTVDYALLKMPASSEADNLFRDRLRIGPVYTPTPDDQGKRLFLLDRNGVATPMECTHVRGEFTVPQGRFHDVIVAVADRPIVAGQSGGALIDESHRLWGFLLGLLGSRFSVFAPAQLIFDVAGVRLANF